MRTLVLLVSSLLFAPALFADEPVASPKEKSPYADIVGVWGMTTEVRGRKLPATLTIKVGKGGKLEGVWSSMAGDTGLADVTFVDGTLKFVRTIGSGARIPFVAKLADGKLTGHHVSEQLGQVPCNGVRRSASPDVDPNDPEEDFARRSMRAAPRDAFPVLDHPKMSTPEEAQAKSMSDDVPVIGIEIAGQAKAYPIDVMGRHELVNDHCGDQPIAVSW